MIFISRIRTLLTGIVLVGLVAAACSGTSDNQSSRFEGFDGCRAGANSAIVFLQRTLDTAGTAREGELAALLPDFDSNVRAMMFRAREVQCTEEGFNAAVIARADELASEGPGGDALIVTVRSRGFGSLDEGSGGLITLP